MFDTKYKYFNKKIKMFLLFSILMWSLMGQIHVYDGKSSMYDTGIVMVAAAAGAKDFDNVTDSIRKTIQENIAAITRTNDAMKTSSKIIAITTTTTAIETATNEKKVKGINVTTATIYGHINEKDNNSNKLPQNVTTRDQQQPTNMMYMNMKMPAPSQTTSSSSLSSSLLSTMSAGVTATQTAGILQRPTESWLMPKDQLNKAESHENVKSNKNIPEDTKERKILKVKLNDKRPIKTVENSSNNLNIDSNILKNNKNYITTDSNLYETSNGNKFIKVKDENNKNIFGPAIKAFESIEHAYQQLISEFALKLKKIPRVTYFTCKKSFKSNESFKNLEFVRRVFLSGTSKDSSLMMKVVLIDHLVNKNQESLKNIAAFAAANDSASRKSFNHLNWFEHILRPETLRQIVVLNLACGASSRRLLEMASTKAFFNSMYHWLLLEDYVFNRQTEIDDANNIESKMNSNSYSHSNSNSYKYSTEADKRFKREEIVNDSNVTNLQVRKLSTYPTDVVDASTSDSGPQKQNNITPATNLTSTSYSAFTMFADNRQEQCFVDKKSSISVNASRAGITTDEDDIEIIEKFLEKLNININTELILAKRCMRSIIMPSMFSPTATTFDMMATPSPSPALSIENSTSTDSHDYKNHAKMDYYLLYDVWSPGQQYGGVLNVSEIGHFTPSEGLQLSKWYRTTSITKRRIDMQLARIRCLIVVTHKNRSDTLEEYLTSHYDTHLDSMNRFNYALLTYVKDIFNFSIILSKTSSWGYLKNGKFDGMIGALVRKQADIGGSPIFSRIERAKVIDYTARTWVARPCFIFRHPSTTQKDRIVFLQPFSYKVWMFLFFSGCLTVVLLWLLTSLEHKFSPYDLSAEKVPTKTSSHNFKTVCTEFQHNLKENIKPEFKTEGLSKWFMLWFKLLSINKSRWRVDLFFDSFLFYIGSICQQGLSFTTAFFSGRCIVITSLLFSFAIYQFYSASIVGTLLMEKQKTIRTLRDLIHSSLEIGIEDIVYNRDYFLRTKDPDAQELYAKKVTSVPMTKGTGFVDTPPDGFALPTKMTDLTDAQKAKAYRDILHSHETGAHAKTNEASNWYEPDYGVAKVKKGHFAFHVDVATAYKIIADTFSEKEICELTEIQLFPSQKMVSIVQKGSPLRKALTYGLRRITEVGLTDYQRKVWHSPKPRCVKQLHADDLRVDMQTFTSALLVLIFGYAVSLLILSLEIVHFKLWQRYAMS